MTQSIMNRLREICLSFPEAREQEAWGHPTFRVRDKIFAACGNEEERLSMTCKAPPGAQEVLVATDPERFFRPAYVGHRGWIGVRLAPPIDWDQITDLVEESYRMTAPKRLSARLDSP